MYKLILSKSERDAIDWIGYRYFHGDDLYKLLIEHASEDWDYFGDVLFTLPEHIAWQIRDGLEDEEYQFTCLSGNFANKLMSFCDQIV